MVALTVSDTGEIGNVSQNKRKHRAGSKHSLIICSVVADTLTCLKNTKENSGYDELKSG